MKPCDWVAAAGPLMAEYRDREWGLPVHGDRFVGSTVIYAHMQAVGMVNDHLVDCFRHDDVQRGD